MKNKNRNIGRSHQKEKLRWQRNPKNDQVYLSLKHLLQLNLSCDIFVPREGKTFNIEGNVSLRKNLLKTYENFKSNFGNQHGEAYYELIGNGLFNFYQSSLLDMEEALKHINHRISFTNEKPRKEPLGRGSSFTG